MKLNPNKFAATSATAFALLWVICSATVYLLPESMMTITGHMMHGDFSSMSWTLIWAGFVVRFIAWVFCAWIIALLIVIIYKRLLDH